MGQDSAKSNGIVDANLPIETFSALNGDLCLVGFAWVNRLDDFLNGSR